MAPPQRRRHNYLQRFPLLIPLISAVAAALMFLYVLLSLLAPSPNETNHIHRPRLHSSFDFQSEDNASGDDVFRVPITDAVVAARILNATLVVPKLDQRSFWKDSSNFSDIFDVDWFINYLSNDVKIIKELPGKVGKRSSPYSMRVPRKCSERCYINRILPVLQKKHAVQLSKYDYRLANRLDTEYQKLRCRVNYHALRFTNPILTMGKKLVRRMRMRSKHYIALHLR
ncbi:hypothetical protein PIB30_004115 [Stylosanthes scabra]|uniref:O-fucosyltransferase family protein n=1 Tax=Stylosanthes scabra TaxID=79078 RepID=A0ABU6Q4H6_9FABA|nr:hypothetical protein [Stylosanthes scabra]